MPSYLCESVLSGKFNTEFYEINKDLTINFSFLKKIKPQEVVVIINYFGFPQSQSIYDQIKEKKAISIQDASQSLFSKNSIADFTIYSLTKLIGIPDGAMIETDLELDLNLENPPADYISRCFEYKFKRTKFDLGEDNNWHQEYIAQKNKTPIGNFKMSETSKNIWNNNLDHQFMIDSTVQNFQYLQNFIKPIKHLEKDVVPIGFPILCKNRDATLNYLISEKIYPPIHWNLKKVPKTFNISYEISQQELTIPCDYRYNITDMEKIVKCLSKISY